MDGLIALSIGLPSTAAIITGGALWMQSLKSKSNANGNFVKKEVCSLQVKVFEKNIADMRADLRESSERLESKIDSLATDIRWIIQDGKRKDAGIQ